MSLLLDITNEKIAVFQWGVLIGASLLAAVCDVRQRRIPNALTGSLFLAGLLWSTWFGGVSGLAQAIAACILVALPYVLLFVFAGGGAGDAKLMGAIGAWLGLRQALTVLICVATAGGILALARAILKKRLRFVLTSVFVSCYAFIVSLAGGKRLRPASNNSDSEQYDGLNIPYGVAIFAGVCAAAAVVWLLGAEWLW